MDARSFLWDLKSLYREADTAGSDWRIHGRRGSYSLIPRKLFQPPSAKEAAAGWLGSIRRFGEFFSPARWFAPFQWGSQDLSWEILRETQMRHIGWVREPAQG